MPPCMKASMQALGQKGVCVAAVPPEHATFGMPALGTDAALPWHAWERLAAISMPAGQTGALHAPPWP
eukprot:362938-Chlamydomonas_euryale.AAC.2